MKLLTSIYLVILLFLSQVALAEPGFQGNREHQQFMRMLHHLDLSAEQKVQVHSIMKAAKPQMKALMIKMSEVKSQLDAVLDNDRVDQAKVEKFAGQMSEIMRNIILNKARIFTQVRATWNEQQLEKFQEMRIKRDKIRAIMLDDEQPE